MGELGTAIFDFIVVGGGSAGCVLANRLSASGRHRVLLLEAGGEDRHLWTYIPLGYGKTFLDPRVNWKFETEPEPELENRAIYQPRGKVLGGSSAINGLLYIRGQRQDYDYWRQRGCVGWSYEDVLPYFRRAEAQQRGEDEYHGGDGPLSVQDQSESHELCDAFIAAAQQAGFPRNDDFNGATQEGAGYYQMTTRNGRRCSTNLAYLKPARNRPNLAVVTRALTCRVLVEGKEAVGVEYRQGADPTPRIAKARREIVLTAGSYGSPQILQLSGIGPAARLQGELGIKSTHDLPGVGEDLQDHLQARIMWRSRKKITFNDDMASLRRRLMVGYQYMRHRKGPLTVSAGYAGGFFRTDPRLDSPDVQVILVNFSFDSMGEGLHKHSGFMTGLCQLRPESRGWVRIKSADPAQPPAIRPNYLSAEGDKQTMVAGLKLVRQIMGQEALEAYVEAEADPGPDCTDDAALLAYVRRRGTTVFHPTSSCRMGTDPRAVVDPRLRVHGLAGLRVADASIMPAVVSGNTNAGVIMIGEKAADMILEDAGSGEARSPRTLESAA